MTAAEEQTLRAEGQRVRDPIWRQIVDQMTASGVPLEDAREGTDLALHAVEQATTSLIRTCENASDGMISALAVQVAAQLLPCKLETLLSDVQAAVAGPTSFSSVISVDSRGSVQ